MRTMHTPKHFFDLLTASGVFGLSFLFEPLNMAMSNTVGSASEILTLGIQALSLVYIAVKTHRLIKERADDKK